MKRALALPIFLLGLVVHTSSADAQSFHEKVEVKELTTGRGATKKVVGLKLTLTLRPESYSTQDKVRISLGPMTPKPDGANYDWHREAVTDKSKGYVLHQWPDVKINPKTDKAKEITLEVKYDDAPELKAFFKKGAKVEVISAWNSPDNRSYWHVWGIQSVIADPKSVITLPEPTPEAAPKATEATAAEAATARTPRARKPRTTTPRARASRATSSTTRQSRQAQRRTALRARHVRRGR